MRFVLASLAIHALVVWMLVDERRREVIEMQPPVRTAQEPTNAEPTEPIEIEMIGTNPAAGGSPAGSSARATSSPRRARSTDAWQELSIRTEGGAGVGQGHGTGNAIGFGNGSGVQVARDVPTPPAPPVPIEPPVSKARPAKLIWPTRDVEVEDEADLFVARITVDRDGSVVGARMVKTRPGSRGDHAANAIWQFRYAPALDEHGVPTRSTFEQPFQVR